MGEADCVPYGSAYGIAYCFGNHHANSDRVATYHTSDYSATSTSGSCTKSADDPASRPHSNSGTNPYSDPGGYTTRPSPGAFPLGSCASS